MAEPFNPYMPMPSAESDPWTRVLGLLGNSLVGAGAGISSTSGTGQPWMAGVAPGLQMGMASYAKQQQEALQYQQMEAYRKAQEAHLNAQTDVARQGLSLDNEVLGMIRKQQGGDSSSPPGLRSPEPPLMSVPGTPRASGPPVDLQKGGAPIVNYLMSQHGLSPQAAAGVAGNLFQESGFNSTAVGDGGKSRGIAQWDPDRYAGLTKFAAAAGGSPTDPKTQIDYLMAEMKGGDMGAQRAYALLQQAKTPEEAAAAMMHFERPQGYTPANPTAGHGFAQRAQYAQALMPNGSPVMQGGGDVPGGPQKVQFQPPAVGQVQPYALPPGLPDPSAGNAYALSPRFAPYGTALRSSAEFKRKEALDLEKFNYERQQNAEKQALEARKALVGEAQGDVVLDQQGNASGNQVKLDTEAAKAGATARAQQEAQLAYAGASTLTKAAMERHEKEVMPGAEAVSNSLPNLYELKRLTEGPIMAGPGLDMRMLGNRVKDMLNLGDVSDAQLNTTEFINRSSKRVLEMLQTKALGSGTGISEGDRKFMESASAHKGDFTKEELQRLTDIGIKSAHTSLDQYGKAVDRLYNLPGVSDIKRGYFDLPKPSYADWQKANPPGTPAAAVAAPPQATPKGPPGADFDKYEYRPNPNVPSGFDRRPKR